MSAQEPTDTEVKRRSLVALGLTLMASSLVLPLILRREAGAAAPQVHEIEIKTFKFSPKDVVVQPGDTVRWTNKDLAPHTATALDESWDSGTLKRNESWSLEITEETAVPYYCRFHPKMKATFELA